MWVMVFFDLPTETKAHRKAAHDFRHYLLKDGFLMFQYSIYMRFCASREHADTHMNRVKKAVPPEGFVGILHITDRQYDLMKLFRGAKPAAPKSAPTQLELF
jgi:CRISPR-associated protein Cas2